MTANQRRTEVAAKNLVTALRDPAVTKALRTSLGRESAEQTIAEIDAQVVEALKAGDPSRR
jgi:hypothetical protein